PLFEQWFGIKVAEKDEYSSPRKREELICLTEKARQDLQPKGLNELMSNEGAKRIEKARQRLVGKSPAERRQILRNDWSKLLGPVNPIKPPIIKAKSVDDRPIAGAKIERIVLEVEPGISVPVILLAPVTKAVRSPVVVGLAQAGKAGFLKDRAN